MEKGWFLNMHDDKLFNCSYKFCLHHGEKVNALESVVINKKHYHWDCAAIKQEIKDCADLYIEYIDDKTQYPMVLRIINTLVFKNRVPVEFIMKNIVSSKNYYSDKPAQILYGLRKLFWEKEFK